MKTETKEKTIERPPIVVVMGHIDHGKSTLLDYIRKTNVVDSEAGGITQCISAYEVSHKDESGKDKKITFLDTPGHEAFSKMRERGAKIADIAILVVSAEDGVKPQTLEAWKTISESKTPCIVAINKIDKPNANIEKTKAELAENEIYLEDYGGKTPFALISAKEGTGVDGLLSLVNILAELENFTGNREIEASGVIIEANLDPKRGIKATLIIKDGILKKGMIVVAGEAVCSTRIMENFLGHMISEASFSSPIRLVGFDKMPIVGTEFRAFKNKDEALAYAENSLKNAKENKESGFKKETDSNPENINKIISIVLKADVAGMVEAIQKEIGKIKDEGIEYRIVQKGAGPIGEADVKVVVSGENSFILGFNVKADKSARELAEKRGIGIFFFDIIYKMTEWLKEEMEKRKPKTDKVETTGRAKIIKTFSRTKERQIMGGKVTEGAIALGNIVKIVRRDFEIGRGKIVNLEKNKVKVSSVEEGSEFGMMIESKMEVAAGDIIESFTTSNE